MLVRLLFTVSCLVFVYHGVSGEPLTFLETVMRLYTKTYPERPLLPEYDFIVVGSGPGGAAVINRLSENSNWKVLLLEAGGEQIPFSEWPLIVSYFQLTSFNWGYKAEKQPGQCQSMIKERCRWPRGKGLGGSSVLNYMIYTRGTPRDYDRWAAMGNPGWSYNEVYPYFLKIENMTIPELKNSPHHSTKGYVPVGYNPYKSEVVEAFLESSKYVNQSKIDYNQPENYLGFSRIQATTRNGKRVSSYHAYIEPVRSRPNLHISLNSQVTRVLIASETKTVYGVEFVKNGKKRIVFARKEVILSAGAINTPQILMHSGIGPHDHLKSLGIKVEKSLPVGENLQDHITMAGLAFTHNSTELFTYNTMLAQALTMMYNISQGGGKGSIPGGVEGIGFIQTKYNKDPSYPDIEFIFAIGSLAADSGHTVRRGMGISDECYNQAYKHLEEKNTWTIWPMLLLPKSRGRVLLGSRNPLKSPLLYGNYFEDESDLWTLVEGIKLAVALSRTPPFQKIGSQLNPVPMPGCKQHVFESDEYWACTARQITATVHHMSGTCRMGMHEDGTTVVDNELRVHGINRLRVADASVMPILIAAHPMAPIYMIGEKAADMIKSTWDQLDNKIIR
uniref:Glucose dehydrogenase [FAD, quinone] n=2 Tax=Cacopsylla melanoneura TaxID=428564 RepID=A0A8D9ALF9_9HEMI